MKKMDKSKFIIKAISDAIEHAKDMFVKKYPEESIVFSYEEADDEDTILPLLLTSYDYKHHKLVSNWINNAYNGASREMNSTALEKMCNDYGVDIPHLTWDKDYLVDKIRYVQIIEREFIPHKRANIWWYTIVKETGYEYDIFKDKVKQIQKARLYDYNQDF